MNHTIYEKTEFELITRDGKLTWVEKGNEDMRHSSENQFDWVIEDGIRKMVKKGKENVTMHDQILAETKRYEELGRPLPDFSEACWIPFFKSYTDFGYALVNSKTSKVVAKLTFRHNFFEGNLIYPEGRYIGEFTDAHKAKLFVEEELYGKLIAEFDIYLIEEWVVPV